MFELSKTPFEFFKPLNAKLVFAFVASTRLFEFLINNLLPNVTIEHE